MSFKYSDTYENMKNKTTIKFRFIGNKEHLT